MTEDWNERKKRTGKSGMELAFEDGIRSYYNQHPNLTLQELSRIKGRSVEELKKILMEERN